jgi:transcriptional regulator with XRE-family HTH domain
MNDSQFGSVVRALRLRRGWSQAELAVSAGVTRSLVSVIERGQADRTTVQTIRRVSSALGVSVSLAPSWRGAELAKLLDAAHAVVVGAVVKRLDDAHWTIRPEHTFSIWGERGSIDILGWHPAARAILCVECKTRIADLQDLLSTMDRKRRLASDIARLEGWDPAFIGSVLVVPDATWSRNATRRSAALFDVSLPARTIDIRRWLIHPAGDIRGIWFLRNDTGTSRLERRGGEFRARPRK